MPIFRSEEWPSHSFLGEIVTVRKLRSAFGASTVPTRAGKIMKERHFKWKKKGNRLHQEASIIILFKSPAKSRSRPGKKCL